MAFAGLRALGNARGKIKYLLGHAPVAVALCALVGCSSSLFTGDNGSELDRLKGDGRFNKLCLGLDLSKEALAPETAKGLINCLNSNGSIQEYADLVNSLSSHQLEKLVGTLNQRLVTNHTRLKQLDHSYRQMDERGILDRGFGTLSKVLAKSKLVRAGVRLIRQSSLGFGGAAPTKVDPAILKAVGILAEEIRTNEKGEKSSAIVRDHLERGLSMSIMTASLKSYDALIKGLQSTVPLIDPAKGLRYFSDHFVDYVQAKIKEKPILAKQVLWGIEDGTMLQAFDHYYSQQCEAVPPSQCAGRETLSIDSQVSAMEALMRVLNVDHKEDVLRPMVNLFRSLDTPIQCMAGTKQVPNADMFVMNEFLKFAPLDVPSWASRTNIMKIKLANGMCEFPPGTDGSTFNELIAVLRKLADFEERGESGQVIRRRPLVTVTQFLGALEHGDLLPMSAAARADIGGFNGEYPENERFRRFLIHWMGDKGERNIYTDLADALGEFSRRERAVLGNIFYLLNAPAPDSRERQDLRAIVRAIMTLRPALAAPGLVVPGTNPAVSRSAYDVLSNSLLRGQKADVYELFSAMSEFIDSPDKIVLPMLQVARDSLLVNDVNPITDLALEIALDADKDPELFNVLLEIIDTPQFEKAMTLTAKMSGNGTLKELLGGILTMFRATSERAPGNPVAANVPSAKLADPARDKTTEGRPAWRPTEPYWPPYEDRMQACGNLDIDQRFSEPFPGSDSGRTRWISQMKNLAACVDANGQNKEAADAIRWASEKNVVPGKSLAGYAVELVAGLIPELPRGTRVDSPQYKWLQDVYDELGDVLTNDSSFRDARDMNAMLPFLFGKKYCTAREENVPYNAYSCPRDAEMVSVVQGLARALGVFNGENAKLNQLLDLSKTAVQNRGLPKAVALAYDINEEADANPNAFETTIKPFIASFPLNAKQPNTRVRDALIEQIRYYEKREPTEAILQQKMEEYYTQPLPDRKLEYFDYAGKPRGGYRPGRAGSEEFKNVLKPLLDQLSIDQRVEWSMTFFYFLDGNPYTPEWWESWFARGAAEVWPMPYYYLGMNPDKDKPVVRLVNLLDALDMVVAEADFSLRELKENAGVLFKDLDENTSLKYLTMLAMGKEPITNTLQAMGRELTFFSSIAEGPLGFVLKTETKRRLFNLKYIYPLFTRINRMTEFTGSDGKKIVANDLAVLRDLFSATLAATPDPNPKTNKHLFERGHNSLEVIGAMTRLGVLRNASPNMWSLKKDSAGGMRLAQTKVAPLMRFLLENVVIHEGGYRKLNPDTKQIMVHLIREDCDRRLPKYAQTCLINDPKETFNERYVTIGKIIDQIYEWSLYDNREADQGRPRVFDLIKRGGFNALTLFNRLEASTGSSFGQALAKGSRALLGTSKGTELIGGNLDLLDDLLTDPKTVRILDLLIGAETSTRVRGEAQYTDGEAFKSMGELAKAVLEKTAEANGAIGSAAVDLGYKFYKDPTRRLRAAWNAMKWMRDDPEYKAFKKQTGDRIASNLVHWLPKEQTPGTRTRELRPRVQAYLGEQMGNGKLRDLTLFLGDQSNGASKDQFYNQFRFLGDRTYVQKLDDFMDLMRSGIVDVYQLPLPRRF